ncbi:unnamed protein product [Haemonchus placei]|uniref:Uncharacterized protein n=1 Tax=Haemonchus placei TaxID=6290 RepID=A0A0N4VUD1_HAEPC|nr:unnamed protein product [Haemonchus placei]
MLVSLIFIAFFVSNSFQRRLTVGELLLKNISHSNTIS